MKPKLFSRFCWVFLLLLLRYVPTIAQTKTVTGVVLDEANIPLPGVSVKLKNAPTTTVTSVDGKFSISVPSGSAVLVFSIIGYKPMEITVGDRISLSVSLNPGDYKLNEVVVIGYGTQTVKELTGAVSRVSEKNFNKGINTSPDQLVQGKVAGVQVLNNSGAPGGDVTFRIRGTSSVRSGNQPLFVVDGVPLDGRSTKPTAGAGQLNSTPSSNPLSFINPNDIESIDILKDATSTAIYGSRGANGVVIITTKKGKSGAPKLDLNVYTGTSSLLRNIDYMSANQYRETIASRGLNPTLFNGGASVDPLKETLRNGVTQNYDASISGGDKSGNYRISGGYLDQDGIVKKSGFRKLTGNFYGSYKFLENKLTVSTNIIASNTIQQSPAITNDANVQGSLIGNAIEWNPTIPLRDETGAYTQEKYKGIGLGTNPLALLDYYKDGTDINNVLASVSANFQILKSLDYKVVFGMNRATSNRTIDMNGKLFFSEITGRGLASINNADLFSRTLTHTLNYNNKLSSAISLNGLLGYEYQVYKQNNSVITGRDFSSFDVLGTDIIGNSPVGSITRSSYRDPSNSLQSFFGRVNLNFHSKYLLSATFRADGSSKFGDNNKYGYFPSIAGAWLLSEESFFPEIFDNFKLRTGWGKTGNQEFAAGAAQYRYNLGVGSISLANVANPDLRWESSETYNAGVDFSLLRGRLSGTLDIFDKRTNDLLFQLPAIQPAPNAQYWTNIDGTIINRGVELGVNGVLIDKVVKWDLGFNATALNNKFTNYNGAPILTGRVSGSGLGGGIPIEVLANDQTLFVYKLRQYQGLNSLGVAQYSNTAEYSGDPNPDFLLGINTSVSYKKFDFSANFNGAFGHKVYNNTRLANMSPSTLSISRNTSAEVGLSNESLSNANVLSTRFLEKGDYLRLNNSTIGYTFGNINSSLRNLRVYTTGQNLFLITKYSGFDPEVNTDKQTAGVPSFGIEYQPYPTARTFIFGLNVSL